MKCELWVTPSILIEFLKGSPLIEITPQSLVQSEACGMHRLLLVSGASCDQAEHDLLAEMCRSHLSALTVKRD